MWPKTTITQILGLPLNDKHAFCDQFTPRSASFFKYVSFLAFATVVSDIFYLGYFLKYIGYDINLWAHPDMRLVGHGLVVERSTMPSPEPISQLHLIHTLDLMLPKQLHGPPLIFVCLIQFSNSTRCT